ncbi:hypothetical protein TMES_18880 [Thalassospira mesophila]|uniref:Uncharacterized protein n=1 Tax=Thalassospira mesophila TaxID=1293891 RepID=A0A1Y2KW22_9PROT|nr:hypothetical protein TMES_18880 [Thalassospira mesophila]
MHAFRLGKALLQVSATIPRYGLPSLNHKAISPALEMLHCFNNYAKNAARATKSYIKDSLSADYSLEQVSEKSLYEIIDLAMGHIPLAKPYVLPLHNKNAILLPNPRPIW